MTTTNVSNAAMQTQNSFPLFTLIWFDRTSSLRTFPSSKENILSHSQLKMYEKRIKRPLKWTSFFDSFDLLGQNKNHWIHENFSWYWFNNYIFPALSVLFLSYVYLLQNTPYMHKLKWQKRVIVNFGSMVINSVQNINQAQVLKQHGDVHVVAIQMVRKAIAEHDWRRKLSVDMKW